MPFSTQHIVFIPVIVLIATAMLALIVAAFTDWRVRRAQAKLAAPAFRPVLVHDRSRQKLIRSARKSLNRAGAAKIRLVYNGG
jgi:Na+-translocating ferredoxin:NAD+ oxidoreductase RnfG subunit